MLAAAKIHIGMKAERMSGECWKRQDLTKAERERDELRERLGIHSEECKAKDREVKNLTSERKAEILEMKVTTAEAKKEMWSILCSLTTNRSVPTERIITDIGKNFISQKTLPTCEQFQASEIRERKEEGA